MRQKTGCLICGERLVYSVKNRDLKCYYCGKKHPSKAACGKGHFVCDDCHGRPAAELIEKFCIISESNDPIRMAIALMKNARVAMHGPEHHFLVPAVLLSAHYNASGRPNEKASKIREAKLRSGDILGGFCGFHGNCGAAVGTGIFVSLVTGATPLSKYEWKLANLMTAQSLKAIALRGGPRCCKRDSFIAISEAVKFVRKNLKSDMKAPRGIRCEFSALNRECLGRKCPFHQQA